MIHVTIYHEMTGMSVCRVSDLSGHAEMCTSSGKDIVCAAASSADYQYH